MFSLSEGAAGLPGKPRVGLKCWKLQAYQKTERLWKLQWKATQGSSPKDLQTSYAGYWCVNVKSTAQPASVFTA